MALSVKVAGTWRDATPEVKVSGSWEDVERLYVKVSGAWQLVSAPWDLSIASYDGVAFDVSGQDGSAEGLFFKPDGTKMYVLGTENDGVHQYTLSTPWDVSSATYDSASLDVSDQDTSPTGLAIKPDGTKLYIVGLQSDRVHQYTLSTPWSLGTASYDGIVFFVGSQDIAPTDLVFKPDGTKMYITGNSNDSAYQYTLSSPWDITTATYDSVSLNVSSQDSSTQGLVFKPDGTKMYMVGDSTDRVYQYTLSTPWDLATASYDGVSFDVSGQETLPRAVFFRPNGTKMYVVGNVLSEVYQYSLDIGV